MYQGLLWGCQVGVKVLGDVGKGDGKKEARAFDAYQSQMTTEFKHRLGPDDASGQLGGGGGSSLGGEVGGSTGYVYMQQMKRVCDKEEKSNWDMRQFEAEMKVPILPFLVFYY